MSGVTNLELDARGFGAQVEAGHGVGLLDPHGDLAERVLGRVPRGRRRDLVVIDPATDGAKPSLNLVGYRRPAERPVAAAAALSVLRRTFAESWGPRTEHVLRNAILTQLDVPRSTLAGVLCLIADERYRVMAMCHVRDPIVRYPMHEHRRGGRRPGVTTCGGRSVR